MIIKLHNFIFLILMFLLVQTNNSLRSENKGLHNLGNSCYMNASLQCLSNIELLRKFVAQYKNDYIDDSIPKKFLKVIEGMRGTGAEALRDFHKTTTKKYFQEDEPPQGEPRDQQDAQEFIQFLFGNDIGDKFSLKDIANKETFKNDFNKIFNIGVTSVITCPQCHTKSIKTDPAHQLATELQKNTLLIYQLYLN